MVQSTQIRAELNLLGSNEGTNQIMETRNSRFINCTVIDALSTEPRELHIAVENGEIAEVSGSAFPDNSDIQTIDLGDACLAPGLIDGHTHLSLAGDGRPYVEMFAETDWPFRIAGVVDDFDPKLYVKPRKSLKLMCREIQFGFGF